MIQSNGAEDALAVSAQAKASLRKSLRLRLQSRQTAESREASEFVIAQALQLFVCSRPGVWLSYRGFGSEVRLPARLAAGPVQFAFPVVDRFANRICFYSATSAQSGIFAEGTFGIEAPDLKNGGWTELEPGKSGSVVGALVPGLGFNRHGVRLGRGRGFYDRFLSETDERRMASGLKPLLKVGIGFHEQIVEDLPCEMHDVRLDAVLTDREWITPVKGVGNE